MSEITPLSEIVEDAERSARDMAATGITAKCPYPEMSCAAARWNATVQRYLLQYSLGEAVEGSA